MKKFMCVILSLCFFVATAFCTDMSSFADEIPLGTQIKDSNTYYYYNASDKTLYINGYGDVPNLSNSSADIPWMEWPSTLIENVVVADGITSIGNYMFYGVMASSFSLPRSLKKIGNYSFASTNGMKHWDIPFGVEKIDDNAFFSCRTLESINLPNSLKSIGNKTFSSCSKLKSIVIPYSVTSIGSNAFYRCTSLSDVRFASPTQIIDVSNRAFYGCTMLSKVTLPYNINCNSQSFGYGLNGSVLDGFSLELYASTQSQIYADTYSIDYIILDTFDLKSNTHNENIFTQDKVNSKFHYTFTPDKTQNYSIYSLGECDTYAELYLNGELLEQSDDVDPSNRGFSISYQLNEGETYDIYVGSVKQTGNYTLYLYPSEVTSFDVYKGSIAFSASDGKLNGSKRIFNITNNMMNDFVLDVGFADGSVSSMYFCRYIAGAYVLNSDNQEEKPFNCGYNDAHISLKENIACYPLTISHSYVSEDIPYDVDNDGYTLYTCVNCGDSYKDNFVPTTSYIVTGRLVMDEDNLGAHPNNVGYPYAYITVGNRRYDVNSDGTFQIRTFDNCYMTVNNSFGNNRVVLVDVANGDYDMGELSCEPYDFNKDGCVNAKDFAIYYKELRFSLGEDYWQFADNYIISYKQQMQIY